MTIWDTTDFFKESV